MQPPVLLRRIHAVGWKLTVEAAAELVLARFVTMLPARAYLRNPQQSAAGQVVTDTAAAKARYIGRVVESVARRLPFRARCLQQAIATRRMLARRRLPATLCLGVSTVREDRVVPARGLAAHAWVCVGELVVCGDVQLGNYAVVARFPTH